tara:strand:+ start:370 stop:567 length:198 start_codon:yes stop_codon:yes gene_type:complete
MEDEQDYDYQVNLRIEDIRLLQYCVDETIRTWPGAPRRPAEEQEHLRYLRDSLFRMIMDYNFREL